jgi:hypothetical protein
VAGIEIESDFFRILFLKLRQRFLLALFLFVNLLFVIIQVLSTFVYVMLLVYRRMVC